MGPGPFWIENKKLKNPPKIKIFDDYLFVGNTVKILSQNCTLLVSRHYHDYLSMSEIVSNKIG